jgi:hypothetical protein
MKREVLEFRIEGINASKFLDKAFLTFLKQEVGDIRIEHICCFIPEGLDESGDIKVKDHLIIGHARRKDEANNVLIASTNDPADLEKLMNAIEKFTSTGEK